MNCPMCNSVVNDGASQCQVCGNPVSIQTLPVGTILHQKYEIAQVIGQGGFGITYAARQKPLETRVAIKELFLEGSVRQRQMILPPTRLVAKGWHESKRDFIAEGKILARFNNPDIVRVIDFFEESGTAYLVMEYLEGITLQQQISQYGAIPAHRVEEIARCVLQALDLVHQEGLLHRDIKPENIMIENSGRVVLIDFGSARNYSQGQTVQHTKLVTPGYAPLEQYGNEARFGPYTDIYSLGATLFHALTGVAPPAATDRMLGTVLPALPASTPNTLKRAIEHSLEIKVTDRPQTSREVLNILNNEAIGTPITPASTYNLTGPVPDTTPKTTTQQVPDKPKDQKIGGDGSKVWIAVASAALLLGGGFLAYSLTNKPKTNTSGNGVSVGPVQDQLFQVMAAASSLDIRQKPSATSSKVGVLPKKSVVPVFEEQNGWYSINVDGKDGWIQAAKAPQLVSSEAVDLLISDAKAGGSISLVKGVYVLEEPLILNSNVEMVGEGLEKTWIVSQKGDKVINSKNITTTYKDLSVLWTGDNAGLAVLAEGGTITTVNVRFAGGVKEPNPTFSNIGSGLALTKDAKATLKNSTFSNNGYGVFLSDNSRATINNSKIEQNTADGLVFLGTSNGIISKSIIKGNDGYGILITDEAHPKIDQLKIIQNKSRGISIQGSAKPNIFKNAIQENSLQGIGVQDTAEPNIEANTISNNKQTGIAYYGQSSGSTIQNVLENNQNGISVAVTSKPIISSNSIKNNRELGIAFLDKSIGSATDNVIASNAKAGILISGQAQPEITNNTINANKADGILFSDTSGGLVQKNLISNNNRGLLITNSSTPNISQNTFKDNKLEAISYKDQAKGTASNNICKSNGSNRIQVKTNGAGNSGPKITGSGCS